MYIEKLPTEFCSICDEKNIVNKQYSSLFQKKIFFSNCINNHIRQYPIKYIEVCPICQNTPILDQQTKTCKNNHSWFKCKKCNYITISNKKLNKIYCKKCMYSGISCNCFTWMTKILK